MPQHVTAITLLVTDYDKGIDFYCRCLGFDLIEDTPLSDQKRWVLVAPYGSNETRLLLAQAASEQQKRAIGNQAGGRVFLFLSTDNFTRDYQAMQQKGIHFLEQPRHEAYGTVAVFQDPFGNKWDLIEPNYHTTKAFQK